MNHIRALAICIFRNDKKILVAEGVDRVKKQTFYRPLGGGIEFGERSEETIRREIKEELNEEVTDLLYLGALENIFVFEGNRSHEIVQIFDGRLVNANLFEQAQLDGNEEGAGPFKAVWKHFDQFNPQTPLYPHGLLDMLEISNK
jgi:8-oxo-dGTP pyrophosphatase MutT (NUDIX family)